MNELVSIVMANYNKDGYLEQAIISVLEQDYNNIELIIIDDGSTDNSPNIIQSHATQDSRIIYKTCEHKGKIEAYNYGVSLAKGHYVKIFSSDDVLFENAISLLVKEIGNYDVICHNTTITDELLSVIKTNYFDMDIFNKIITIREVINGVSFPSGCYLFKKETTELIYPIPNDATYEDWYIFMGIINNNCRLKCIDISLSYYRQYNDSTYGGVLNSDKKIFLYRLKRNMKMLDVFKKELTKPYHHELESKKQEFELIEAGDLRSIVAFNSSIEIKLKIILKRYLYPLWLLLIKVKILSGYKKE